MSWWNDNYLFRRNLRITNTFEDASEGHVVLAPVIAEDLYNAGKTRSDYEDIEVIFESDAATPVQTVLAREITDDGIYFFLEDYALEGEEADGQYYVYYGNYELEDAPDRPEYEEDFWSVSREHDDPHFSYTRPGDWWDEGVSSQRGAVATLRMSGARLRIVSDMGPDKGIMEIAVDAGIWTDIDLFAITSSEDTAYEVTNLTEEKHRVQIRVTGRKNPSSSSEEVNIIQAEYQIPLTVENVGEEIYNFDWSSLMSGV